MAINFVPLHDRILVQRVAEEETTRGGLIIPDTAKDKPQEGEVLAVGKGKIKEDGSVWNTRLLFSSKASPLRREASSSWQASIALTMKMLISPAHLATYLFPAVPTLSSASSVPPPANPELHCWRKVKQTIGN